ncbi:MAG: hypothetical protein ACOY3P_24880 [Planctomycetota bacterium]
MFTLCDGKRRRVSTLVRILGLSVVVLSVAIPASAATVSNDRVTIEVDDARGFLTVIDRAGGRTWGPDPWTESAGSLNFRKGGQPGWWNLSAASDVAVAEDGPRNLKIEFHNRDGQGGMPEWKVVTRIALDADAATLRLRVLEVKLPAGCVGDSLEYPQRPFALKTDVDRGAAVIPFWQGIVIPSYIFPMNGGRFCRWDDAVHGAGATGELSYYGWHGLVMPWFGTHDQRSAAMAIVPYDGSVRMRWVANYNNAAVIERQQFRRSPYPRVVSLTPVWELKAITPETTVEYEILPGGDHVAMAKHYRKIAKEKGLLVSLREKAKANPNVEKLKGALYLGIYGGYPHYVNLPGMAFTFDQLDGMVRDMHDKLGLEHAFVHAWGTFSNYAPVMWPISEELGGEAKLKAVVDRIKGYGWLYSSYHSFVSLLEHDPNFNIDLAPKDAQGRPVLRGRWNAVDEERWVELAKACLPKEMAAIGQNADVTDIAFTSKVGEGGRKLADYLASTGLVLGTERGNEWAVPQYHMFEGLVAPYHDSPYSLNLYSHGAPLFNLVYHDAVTNFGKIQDPNQLATSVTGDYYVKSLRAMLHGDGPMLFIAPYEYPGVRPYIRFAAKVLSPLHKQTAFEELVDHDYLSPDFLVQSSAFADGTRVTVNMGPTPFEKNGVTMPPYGFRVTGPGGKVTEGRFQHQAVVDGEEIEF